MATLNEVMKDTADAIREKTGKSEKIAPTNFAEEIKSISAGGGESASTIEYLDVSGLSADDKGVLVMFATILCKMENLISTPISALTNGDQVDLTMASEVCAIMCDLSLEVYVFEQKMAIQEWLGKENLDAIPRLTKEQFYDLNA